MSNLSDIRAALQEIGAIDASAENSRELEAMRAEAIAGLAEQVPLIVIELAALVLVLAGLSNRRRNGNGCDISNSNFRRY